MIRIDRNMCVGCGHCQYIRMALPCIKTVEGVEYYEDPRPEDMTYVERACAECWAHCVDIVK